MSTVLVFGLRINEKCTPVHILGDDVLEVSELFTVELSTSDSEVLLGPDIATITILNNNSEFVWHLIDGILAHDSNHY